VTAIAPPLIAVADGPQRLLARLRDCAAPSQPLAFRNARQLLTAARQPPRRDQPRWDGALIAIGLADFQALAVITQLRRLRPLLPIWASLWADEPYAQIVAVCAGADGWLVENRPAAELRRGLAALRDGQRPLSMDVARRLMSLSRDERYGLDTVGSLADRTLGLDGAGRALLRRIAEGARADTPAAQAMCERLYGWLQTAAVRRGVADALCRPRPVARDRRSRVMRLTAPALGDARGCAGRHSGL